MSVKLIVLLTLAAWALGPVILRLVGGLLLTAALLMWAMPLGTHTSTATLLVTAVTGAAIRHTGSTWRTRRDTGRLRLPRVAPRRGPAADHLSPPTGPQTPCTTSHVDLWDDDDVIDGVARDVERLCATNSWGASSRLRRHISS
jgi:hypothetical protein